MDGSRFDDLARSFGRAASRRDVVRGLTAVIAGGLLGLAERGGAEAARIPRGPGRTCREHADCVSGAQCLPGAANRLVCTCVGGLQACGEVCVDPTTAYQSDPQNCGSCGNRCSRGPCQIATCGGGICGVAPNPAVVGQACSDGDPCTTGTTCQSDGFCAGGQAVAPVLTCPANVTQNNDPNQCGAVVTFPAPTATCPTGVVTCDPPTGSFFPVGPTTVDCTMDGSAATCAFTVTIADTQPPAATCPADQTVPATSANGADVTFTATPSDNCPGSSIVCNPPSGSTFPVGDTPVTCTATDAATLTDECTFTVTITPLPYAGSCAATDDFCANSQFTCNSGACACYQHVGGGVVCGSNSPGCGACASDAECGAGFACVTGVGTQNCCGVGTTGCVQLCASPAPVGDPCTSGAECASGVCDFNGCDGDTRCVIPQNGACTAPCQCQQPYTCVGNTCQLQL